MASSEKRCPCVVEAETVSIDRKFVQVVNNFKVNRIVTSKFAEKHIDIQNYPHLRDISLSPVPLGVQVVLVIALTIPIWFFHVMCWFNHECSSDVYATGSVFGWGFNGFVGEEGEIFPHFVQTDTYVFGTVKLTVKIEKFCHNGTVTSST